MIPVYVPSYQRCGNVLTIDTLKAVGMTDITLVVRDEEYQEYFKRYLYTAKILSLPRDITNIGQTRQFIADTAKEDIYTVADDDICGFSFKVRCCDYGGLARATKREASRVIEAIVRSARRSELFLGSVPDRFTVAKPAVYQWKDYGFARQFVVTTRALARRVRYDRMPFYEDIDVSLQALKLGAKMHISTVLCVETRKRPGGCVGQREKIKSGLRPGDKSLGRTLSERLHELHPDVVSLNPDLLATKAIHRVSWRGAYDIGKSAARSRV